MLLRSVRAGYVDAQTADVERLEGHGRRQLVGDEALLYANGELLQGLDIRHENAWLPPEVTERGSTTLPWA